MIIIARTLAVLLGLIVISKAYLDYKKKNESLFMFAFWLITWIIVIFFSLFPLYIDKINEYFGNQGSGVNTFIGTSFVFLLFITYRVYTKANRIEKQIHDITMQLGLREVEDK